MKYKVHERCRVCDSPNLVKYIDLGNLPLTNNLCKTQNEKAPVYPLQVMKCNDCHLSQLSIVVNPGILFGHYVYRSSINQGYVNHCRQMAIDLKERYDLDEKSFHIDIAGNDGALLYEFKKVVGGKSLNIDPAENLASINDEKGIRMFTTFWGIDAAKHLQSTSWPKADLITATNIFAHVDDVSGFMEAVKMVLKPSGVLVLEFPYLIDFIENGEFDTIYQEHLSYFSIGPLQRLCWSLGLNVFDVEKQDIHGGTVRVHIDTGTHDESISVGAFVEEEEKYKSILPYKQFAMSAKHTVSEFAERLHDINMAGEKIAGFAASAKGNTLLNAAGISVFTMKYIIDETPEKIGMYSPGTHIPIVGMDTLQSDPPDYLVILSWNFAAEIMKKVRKAGYEGKFVIPIPEWKVID